MDIKRGQKMKLNNMYNFKNPVKNFLDIDNLILPSNVSSFELDKLCWVEPIKFRVKKQNDKYRTLKMPNILNFVCAYEYYKDMPDFDSIQSMDSRHKRLSANIDTGDFVSGEYDNQLEGDFNNLCIYDNLVKMDIKEYYGRIYTHNIDFQGHNERFLSNMDLGATNGLIMGNYLSLYFAERNLIDISNDIEKEIVDAAIDCEFSYFSDDFYFYCNKDDNEKIISIFDRSLERYDLERNDNKIEILSYEEFNDYNLVARYWKKLIAHCNIRYDKDSNNNKMYFINQIVYRMSKLRDDKLKKVFVNNFFKTKYFLFMDLNKYKVKDYDYHQLCFIMKFSPEVMLYISKSFKDMREFNSQIMYKFFKVRYREALKQHFNDEQLYYYYAIKMFCFEDILKDAKELVLISSNQVLVSYYLQDEMFGSEDLDVLKTYTDERYWFQNYHLILHSIDLQIELENSIEKYLIPKKTFPETTDSVRKIANKVLKKQSYMSFYMENITNRKSIIRSVEDVHSEITKYLILKIEESEESFNNNTEER